MHQINKYLKVSNNIKMIIKKMVVVQNRPTQFDVPFFAKLNKTSIFDLTVFYTRVSSSKTNYVDNETNHTPEWDNLLGMKYDARFENSTFRLWKEIISLKPRHVIICGWYPRSHALLALLLRLSGVSIGVRSDNTLEHTNLSGVFGLVKRFAMFFWLGVFDTWHPVGSLAKTYMQKLSMIKRPVFYFPYSVDVEWFREQSKNYKSKRTHIRAQLGLSHDDYVVLGVMKWADREDPITLLRAVMGAMSKVPNIKLILIGDGPLREKVKQLSFSFPNQIVMPGYVKYTELPLYYSISDIFVHPARSEPYGVSVQEAMACGLPVIVSKNVGAAADFLVPDMNGETFPAGDVEYLITLLDNWKKKVSNISVQEVSEQKSIDFSYVFTQKECLRCLESIR